MPMEVVFINKTVNSKVLTRSEGKERAKIFSHVQKAHTACLSSSCATCWKNHSASDFDAKCLDERLSIRVRDESGTRRRSLRCSKVVHRIVLQAKLQHACQSVRPMSPLRGLSINVPDPFGSTIVPMDLYMHDMLKSCKFSGFVCRADLLTCVQTVTQGFTGFFPSRAW